MTEGLEVDIDDAEGISDIKNIIYKDNHFYIISNKKDNKLGYFLLDFDQDNPEKEVKYLIQWANKLDIGDVDMHILSERAPIGGKLEWSLVLSYKAVGINTFNVFVFDLKTHLIKYWHEGY